MTVGCDEKINSPIGGGWGGNVACYSTENMEFHVVYVYGECGDAGLDKRIRGEVRWKGG